MYTHNHKRRFRWTVYEANKLSVIFLSVRFKSLSPPKIFKQVHSEATMSYNPSKSTTLTQPNYYAFNYDINDPEVA